MDGGMPLTGADRDSILPALRRARRLGSRRRWRGQRRGRTGLCLRGRADGLQVPAVRGDCAFDGLAEVAPDVPAISNLDRLGCPAVGAVGVGAGAVAADDLHTGVLLEPGGQGVGGAVGQDVDRSSRADVDQDGAVDPALTQVEVVHAQHGRAVMEGGLGRGADQSDQRHPTDRQGQACGQARTGAAAQRQRDPPQRLAGPDAAAAIADGQMRHLLGEGDPVACVVEAEESVNPQVDQHLLTTGRGVEGAPLIVAVLAPRRCTDRCQVRQST